MSFTVTKNGVGIMLRFMVMNSGVLLEEHIMHSFPRSKLMRVRVYIAVQRRLMTFYTVHGMTKCVIELFIIWNMVFWHAMTLF